MPPNVNFEQERDLINYPWTCLQIQTCSGERSDHPPHIWSFQMQYTRVLMSDFQFERYYGPSCFKLHFMKLLRECGPNSVIYHPVLMSWWCLYKKRDWWSKPLHQIIACCAKTNTNTNTNTNTKKIQIQIQNRRGIDDLILHSKWLLGAQIQEFV